MKIIESKKVKGYSIAEAWREMKKFEPHHKELKSLNESKEELKEDKELSDRDAIRIAKIDSKIGVSSAIDELDKLGFDTSSYDKELAGHYNDDDFDEKNLQARDNLFKKLNIKDKMDKAYSKINESKQLEESSISDKFQDVKNAYKGGNMFEVYDEFEKVDKVKTEQITNSTIRNSKLAKELGINSVDAFWKAWEEGGNEDTDELFLEVIHNLEDAFNVNLDESKQLKETYTIHYYKTGDNKESTIDYENPDEAYHDLDEMKAGIPIEYSDVWMEVYEDVNKSKKELKENISYGELADINDIVANAYSHSNGEYDIDSLINTYIKDHNIAKEDVADVENAFRMADEDIRSGHSLYGTEPYKEFIPGYEYANHEIKSEVDSSGHPSIWLGGYELSVDNAKDVINMLQKAVDSVSILGECKTTLSERKDTQAEFDANFKPVIEKGHTKDEYMKKYGKDYAGGKLWDFLKKDFDSHAVDYRDDVKYWEIEDRLFEVPLDESKDLKEMKGDDKTENLIKKIANECKDYLNSPSKDAWSDRCVENIVELSKELEDVHNKQFKSIWESKQLKESLPSRPGKTLGDYRRFLEDAVQELDDFEAEYNKTDNDEIHYHPNTYRIGIPHISTYEGFIVMNEPGNVDEEDDEYDESLKERLSEKNYKELTNELLPIVKKWLPKLEKGNEIGNIGTIIGKILDTLKVEKKESMKPIKESRDRISCKRYLNSIKK